MESARQTILDRIHSAYAAQKMPGGMDVGANYDAIPRAYRRAGSLKDVERVELFEHRLKEYGAGVRYALPGNIAIAIKEILGSRNKKNIVVPDGLPAAWLPEGPAFTIGNELTADHLDRFDGVLTGCTVAIALTGSVVLQNAVGQASGQGPRRISLVPDYHLCVVLAEQIIETLPEAFDLLEASSTLPTTFISGPSATADIEMTRIQGVHGPRVLDVLIVGGISGNIDTKISVVKDGGDKL